MTDPKGIVRRGFDLVSRAYRADDAEEGQYAAWLDDLEKLIEPGPRSSTSAADVGCQSHGA